MNRASNLKRTPLARGSSVLERSWIKRGKKGLRAVQMRRRAASAPPAKKKRRAVRLRRVGARAKRELEVWRRARAEALKRTDSRCERCDPVMVFGGLAISLHSFQPKRVDVHHLRARPHCTIEEKHAQKNLAVLCRGCHDLIESHRAPDWRKWKILKKPGAPTQPPTRPGFTRASRATKDG